MKTILFLLVCVSPLLYSQNVDYNKIILPDDAINTSFEERLVQLAWKNNPLSHIAHDGVKLAQEEAKVIGTDWSTRAGVVGNLNEFNLKAFTEANDNTYNQFFPRYNFYVQLPLSLLFQSPHQKKAARYRVNNAEDRLNFLKLELRTKVLKLYSEYKKTEVIWLIRQETMSDDESGYLLVEQKFKSGDATLEEYMRAQKLKNDMKIQLAIAENDFKKAKLDIEELIGVKLEDVR